MAKDLNNGERLLSAILEGAEAEAGGVLAKAKAAAAATVAEAEAEAARILSDAEAKAKAAHADILERSRTNAGLDSRKHALLQKRAVIDEAFAAAALKLNVLAGPDRDAVLTKLLLENAEGGETVLPASSDAAALAGLIGGVNEKLAAAGKAPLTMGQPRPGLSGGLLLAGPSYEIDCSFEAVLRDLRAAGESGVAGILFG